MLNVFGIPYSRETKMTFNGQHYRGNDSTHCRLCGVETGPFAWAINWIILCKNCYSVWEMRRDIALDKVCKDFNGAVSNSLEN